MFQGVIAGTFLRDGQAALYNSKVEWLESEAIKYPS